MLRVCASLVSLIWILASVPASALGASWTFENAPDPPGSMNSLGESSVWLSGVSCSSFTACTAVGGYVTSQGTATLAERWNGSRWSIQQTPNVSGVPDSAFSAVSCANAKTCTAVGASGSGSSFDTGGKPLIETWNGKRWTMRAAPNPTGDGVLDGISCNTPMTCVAVGETFSAAIEPPHALVETTAGGEWTAQEVQPAPTAPGDTPTLTGIS
jgi:hypothetical protein